VLALSTLSAVPARAELVFFASGASLNVKGHRNEGDTLILSLRGGGEIACPASTVARIAPDEVPYLETKRPVADEAGVADELSTADGDATGIRVNPAYEPIIARVAAEQGVNAQLVRALIQVESGYKPRAVSRRGAVGLMQVMPATARQYGVTNPYDPVSNIEAGIKHLKSLLDRLPLNLALAAYNAGEAAVDRFRGVPPYPETRAYVSRIMSLIQR
jgi:hypothetical protein